METENPPLREHPEGTSVEIKVSPASSRRGVEGLSGGRVSVSVHSPPEKGKANREALKVLSEALGVPPSRLEVLRGHGSRNKTVLIRGLDPAETRRRLKILPRAISY
jgi:uncharacterized protein